MGRYQDLTGRKFGRLLVKRDVGRTNNGRVTWGCLCECGTLKVVQVDSLLAGKTTSCGCFRRELSSKLRTTHGMSDSRLYHIYAKMRHRCFNPKDQNYDRYGGRGITICDEWRDNPKSFLDWALANGYKDSLTIDRINNDGNYEPNNCRWADMKEQSSNTRRNLIYKGETAADASRRLGGHENLVNKRIMLGWSLKEAFTRRKAPHQFKRRIINP